MNTNKKMESMEIVRRAITFDNPPRLPFWQHWNHKMPEFPDDVHNIWEMDRSEAGWFFDNPGMDDWGCGWSTTDLKNIGQVSELSIWPTGLHWRAINRPIPAIRSTTNGWDR